jgi:hypothetical protein
MTEKMTEFEKLGKYAFMACIMIAVVAGVASVFVSFSSAWVALVLVVLGVFVGFTTITEKEVTPFLLAAIALTVASSGGWFLIIDGAVAKLGTFINSTLYNIASFVAPASIILATKMIYELARKK